MNLKNGLRQYMRIMLSSTGVACKNLNRKFIGIELDDTYYEIAKNRINGVPESP